MDGCEEFADKCPRLTRHEVEKCLWEEGEAKDFESFFFFFFKSETRRDSISVLRFSTNQCNFYW